MTSGVAESMATVKVQNVGGIGESTVKLADGVTVLRGRNATNRTSFLQAVMAAFGSTDVSLKADAERGRVELDLDGETYSRTLERTNGGVSFGGEPYLDDASVADLFAFLLESNAARRAVVRGDDLRELLMAPVDTAAIRSEIDRLERERDRLDDEIDDREASKKELPSLESEKRRLSEEIEAKRAELTELEADIEEADADVDESRAEKRELEKRLADLRDLRSELKQVRTDIDLEEQSIESLRGERADLTAERQSLPDAPMGEHERLDDDIARLRKEKSSLESTIGALQDVVQFNERMLDGDESAVAAELRTTGASDGAPTDRLVADQSVVCWTCGSDVPRDRIDGTLADLRTVRQEYRTDIQDLEAEIERLQATRRERERQQRRRERIAAELREIEAELDERETRLDELRERRDALSAEVETVEAAVEELETTDLSAILELHKQANQVEFELGRLESELDDVTDRLSHVEDEVAAIPEVRDRRATVQAELENQRTRVDRLEREAVEEFNDRMEEVLGLLGYDNLERVWIERINRRTESRRTGEKTVFELHVVRATETGAVYEDTVDHLSESEREVIGLTFALAGYLTHDLHETVPIILLDSLEAIDSERVADLVAYFSDYVPYLLVALLPEDAQALPDTYARLDEI